jgi:hypothetical protein
VLNCWQKVDQTARQHTCLSSCRPSFLVAKQVSNSSRVDLTISCDCTRHQSAPLLFDGPLSFVPGSQALGSELKEPVGAGRSRRVTGKVRIVLPTGLYDGRDARSLLYLPGRKSVEQSSQGRLSLSRVNAGGDVNLVLVLWPSTRAPMSSVSSAACGPHKDAVIGFMQRKTRRRGGSGSSRIGRQRTPILKTGARDGLILDARFTDL